MVMHLKDDFKKFSIKTTVEGWCAKLFTVSNLVFMTFLKKVRGANDVKNRFKIIHYSRLTWRCFLLLVAAQHSNDMPNLKSMTMHKIHAQDIVYINAYHFLSQIL